MDTGTKECVACAETIRENARICRFCNTMQNDARFAQLAPKNSTPIKAGKLESSSTETVCSACGEFNAKTQKRCKRCDNFLDHSSGEYQLSDEEAQFRQAAAPAAIASATNLGPTPGIAIAAIVCAFLVPILGLVLGYAARTEVRNASSPKNGDSLATAAIVIGWVWVIIVVLWVVIAASLV